MANPSSTPYVESPHVTDDGRDLYQPGSQDLVKRSTYHPTSIQARYLSLKITHTPTNNSMSPLVPFSEWAGYYEDYESHGVLIEDADVDAKKIPFYDDPVPSIVLKQFNAWMEIVVKIYKMLDDPSEWDREIDRDYAVDSLEVFRNLLLAPGGLKFEHLTDGGTTKFPRLGPCAAIHEFRAAVVESEICAYYEYKPFDELQALIAVYKRLLRKTDANPSRKRSRRRMNTRRYDHSLDRQMPVLIRDVKKILSKRQALEDELEAIPEVGGDWEPRIAQIHKDDNILSEKLHKAREIAHWHYQMLHYIKARRLEEDVHAIPTVMQVYDSNWDYYKPNNGPNFELPSKWQQELHAASLQSASSRSTARSRQQPRRESLQSLLLRVRPFLDDDDDEDDADTVVPESDCAHSDVQSESGYSEADSEESAQTRTAPRRIRPDWTRSHVESENESDSESDADYSSA